MSDVHGTHKSRCTEIKRRMLESFVWLDKYEGLFHVFGRQYLMLCVGVRHLKTSEIITITLTLDVAATKNFNV